MSIQAVIVIVAVLYCAIFILFFYGLIVPLIEYHEEAQERIDRWEEDIEHYGTY